MAAIEFDGVTKIFDGDVVAVDDVDLTVDDGEIYGFLGPNGAGKSTTINMILDLVRPTEGTVTALGMDAQEDTVEIRRRTGVLPEGFAPYKRLTGRQHVQFAIDSKRANRAGYAEELLERVGLADAADRKAGGYSTGMKQRLSLAMALAGEPDLLILDEPTNGLDPAGARDVRQIVREERDRGATIFFSSHILGQVEAVCDRVGIMRAGEFVAEDTVAGLRENLGGETTLVVMVDDADESALDAVRSIDGVAAVTMDGDRVTVELESNVKAAVITAFEEGGVSVRDFETSEASLEELFIAYTEEVDQ